MLNREKNSDGEKCVTCGKPLKPIDPPQPLRRFCTAACRLKAWRKSK